MYTSVAILWLTDASLGHDKSTIALCDEAPGFGRVSMGEQWSPAMGGLLNGPNMA